MRSLTPGDVREIARTRGGGPLYLEDVVVVDTNATNTTGEIPVSVLVRPPGQNIGCTDIAGAATVRATVSVQSFWSEISKANWFVFVVTFLWYSRRVRRRRRK